MATIKILNLHFANMPLVQHPDLLVKIQRVEKSIFPKDEAMDFPLELAKRNTELTIIINDTDTEPSNSSPRLVAYMLHARLHGIALLHKICVLEGYQRKGIATKMLAMLQTKLKSSGCERLQLWVDVARVPARDLYARAGFRESDRSKDYYGPGRTGVKMVMHLNAVW